MQKIFIFVLILAIGLGVGFYFGVVFQKPQTPQLETEGKVTIQELSCTFSEHTFLTIKLNNNFSDRTLKGNVTVYQNGRQWTSEVEWYYTGYGFAEIKCDSIDENQNFRITYTENYPKATYLDRIIEWYEISKTYAFVGGTEQLQIIEVRFPTNTTMTVEVDNTGGSKITIEEVRVDGVARTVSSVSGDLEAAGGGTYTLEKGKGGKFTVSFTWDPGTPYEVAVKTAKNLFGPYPANAPS